MQYFPLVGDKMPSSQNTWIVHILFATFVKSILSWNRENSYLILCKGYKLF